MMSDLTGQQAQIFDEGSETLKDALDLLIEAEYALYPGEYLMLQLRIREVAFDNADGESIKAEMEENYPEFYNFKLEGFYEYLAYDVDDNGMDEIYLSCEINGVGVDMTVPFSAIRRFDAVVHNDERAGLEHFGDFILVSPGEAQDIIKGTHAVKTYNLGLLTSNFTSPAVGVKNSEENKVVDLTSFRRKRQAGNGQDGGPSGCD